MSDTLPVGTIVELVRFIDTGRAYRAGERGIVVRGPDEGEYIMPLTTASGASADVSYYDAERRMWDGSRRDRASLMLGDPFIVVAAPPATTAPVTATLGTSNWDALPPELRVLMETNPASPLCRGFFRARYNLAPSASDTPTTAEGWKTWVNAQNLVQAAPPVASPRTVVLGRTQQGAQGYVVQYTCNVHVKGHTYWTRTDTETRRVRLSEDTLAELAQQAIDDGETLEEVLERHVIDNPEDGDVEVTDYGDEDYGDSNTDSTSSASDVGVDDAGRIAEAFLRAHPEFDEAA